MTTATKSKLAYRLEQMFSTHLAGWQALPSGLELRVYGQPYNREILVRRPGSRPSDTELRVVAEHAGFDDWHVFWLAKNPDIAWVIEVLPDGLFKPDLWLEARGKTDAVQRPVTPDIEDQVDYLESLPAPAPEVTVAHVEAMLEPEPTPPLTDAGPQLLEFGAAHGWPMVQLSPGVRLTTGQDNWQKFVSTRAYPGAARALEVCQEIDPGWWKILKLGGQQDRPEARQEALL